MAQLKADTELARAKLEAEMQVQRERMAAEMQIKREQMQLEVQMKLAGMAGPTAPGAVGGNVRFGGEVG
jgi:hypothetical protein